MLQDVHAPRQMEKSTAEYAPTPEDKAAISLVEKLFGKAKAARSQYDGRWLDYYKMFRGQQWKEQRPSYRHSECINFIFQTIQSVVPIMTDTRPRFEYVPQEPTDRAFAELMSQIAESDWTRHNWMERLVEVVYDGHFYGAGLSSLTHDPKADLGAGAIVYESEDPFYCYPDPESRDVNRRGRYFVHAEPLPVDVIKARYPDVAEYIKPDILDMNRAERSDMKRHEVNKPANSYMAEGRSGPDTESVDKDKALLICLYCQDDDFEDVLKEEKGEGGDTQKYYEQRKKFPKGRKIVTCNKVLCENGENPYDDGEFPYQRWQNYVLPREFWGISEVEQLESPQRTFNKLLSFSLDVLTLMGNPIWVVSTDADVDTEALYNRPGLVVEKAPGSEVRREEGVQLQPFVLQLIDRLVTWFNDVGGTQDVSRGATPGGVTAASAISNLQEAALTRVRQKSRNLDTYLQCLGQQYASRVMQYYTAPKVYRLTNSEGATQFFKAEFTAETPDQPKTMSVQKWNGTGYDLPAQYQLRGKLDVKVATGSTLPILKAEKEERLFKLFQLGIIDQEEVLKGLQYPNAEAVLARQAEKAQAAAQAQAKPPA